MLYEVPRVATLNRNGWQFSPEYPKTSITKEIEKDESLQCSIKGFLEIGHIRNILVHSNFAAYNSIPKTIIEFHELFLNGESFLDFFEAYLFEYKSSA